MFQIHDIEINPANGERQGEIVDTRDNEQDAIDSARSLRDDYCAEEPQNPHIILVTNNEGEIVDEFNVYASEPEKL